jgi:hypothetical protein
MEEARLVKPLVALKPMLMQSIWIMIKHLLVRTSEQRFNLAKFTFLRWM